MLLWERMNRMMFHGTDGNEFMQNVQLAFEMLQKINVLYSWGLNEMWIEHFIKLLTDSMGLVYTGLCSDKGITVHAQLSKTSVVPEKGLQLVWVRKRLHTDLQDRGGSTEPGHSLNERHRFKRSVPYFCTTSSVLCYSWMHKTGVHRQQYIYNVKLFTGELQIVTLLTVFVHTQITQLQHIKCSYKKSNIFRKFLTVDFIQHPDRAKYCFFVSVPV